MTETPEPLTQKTLEQGAMELASRDADLADIVKRLGVPPLWPREPGFATLVHIILEQQISLKAALTMLGRLENHLGELTPSTVLNAGDDSLRGMGLTRQKSRYCLELASRVDSGELVLENLPSLPTEEGRQALLKVPGLGPWSVDVYYMTALRKPDVWPFGDLALADAMAEVKGLDSIPTRDDQARISETWAPWRAVAARLLWAHYLDARGQLTSP
ncbi:DNA-3-methyladenine glycosylase family protein [Marinobacter confluentis]|uniref:DNA-3-methyladenine glycosylase II n=1 Tax=Marinobacter confluentis TaxID=1697557 RepID=A0A4Z1BP78_9GAMM|nr:DNA-3-methyladenine glycosylase [Marinobacter confluentis]TGN39287.1 DNA-3-methyladenine glycosylase 2 family protein [Marinobacter confluentis]